MNALKEKDNFIEDLKREHAKAMSLEKIKADNLY